MNALAKLELGLTEDGRVEVSGPIANDMLCYGMLEKAKDAIREWNKQEQKNRSGLVVAGPGQIPEPPKNGAKNRLPPG